MRGPHNIIRLIRTGATLERTGAMNVVLDAFESPRAKSMPLSRLPRARAASRIAIRETRFMGSLLLLGSLRTGRERRAIEIVRRGVGATKLRRKIGEEPVETLAQEPDWVPDIDRTIVIDVRRAETLRRWAALEQIADHEDHVGDVERAVAVRIAA